MRGQKIKYIIQNFLVILCILSIRINAQIDTSFTVGQIYFGFNDYTEFIAGDYPIIISAPHGGYLKAS